MQRRQFLKSAGSVVAGSALAGPLHATTASAPSTRKPNILFILADDLGIGDCPCYGADHYRTPNIDHLAATGTRFTHFYTAPLCGPSRALIMTGRYAFRTGATNQDATGTMRPSVELFQPSYLKPAGYKTCMVGKWGQLPLGDGLGPHGFGFDEYFKFKASGKYWNYQRGAEDYEVNGKTIPLRDHEYLPDLMHNFLVDFLERNQHNPFYAYYSLSHVHAEILPTPDSPPNSSNLYADNIVYMDKLVGRILAELDRLKLRDNTLVVFVGDNGTAGPHADAATIGGRRLSGQKGTMLEGGALVPFIVNWPGRTPAGKVNDDMLDSTDFIPTFAELIGQPLPADRVLDGRSMLPQIHGHANPNARDTIFIELGPHWYIREKHWKLTEHGDLLDMHGAPFTEPVVPPTTTNPEAIAARKRLQAALDKLNPAGGIRDSGDGTGRHANHDRNQARRNNRKRAPIPDDKQ
jgi:arylsulfatase A